MAIVEMKERILNTILDEEASALEEKALKEAGVEIIPGHTVSKIGGYLPGEVTGVSKIRRPRSVEEYLRLQRRFAHIFKPGNEWQLERMQALADRNIRRYGLV